MQFACCGAAEKNSLVLVHVRPRQMHSQIVFVWDGSGIGIGDFPASAFVWSE